MVAVGAVIEGIGLVLGVSSAYFGGWFDLLFQRVLDVLMAFPLIILALAVVAVFGTGVFNVILAITIPLIPRCGRVVRASALSAQCWLDTAATVLRDAPLRLIPHVPGATCVGITPSAASCTTGVPSRRA